MKIKDQRSMPSLLCEAQGQSIVMAQPGNRLPFAFDSRVSFAHVCTLIKTTNGNRIVLYPVGTVYH